MANPIDMPLGLLLVGAAGAVGRKVPALALVDPRIEQVSNLLNGYSIIVLVNPRGSFKKDKLINLSHGAETKIGLYGLTKVKVKYIGSLAENDQYPYTALKFSLLLKRRFLQAING